MNRIRIKIIIFFVAFISFMTLNTAMYGWNIVSFRDRLGVLDHFHELLSDILEIRRYEKNYIFYPEPGSLKEMLVYIEMTEQTVGILQENIVEIGGEEEYQGFISDLKEYKERLHILSEGGKTDFAQVRRLGTAMVGFAQRLLDLKKQRIHDALISILYIPICVMIGLAALITVLFIWQAKRVMDRLAYVQQAAEGVAKGDYEAIQHIKSDDYASKLMRSAFSKMAEEIESRQEQLIESRKLVSIGTLTSGIAHELNNPLNNVSLTADTLLEEFGELSEVEAKEMLLDIINETSRASEVVRNLLDFSREDRQPMTRLKVAEVIRQTLKLVGNQLMLDHVRVISSIPDDLPDIRGDLHYLEQVFINLFMNATQAMPEGGVLSISARSGPEGYVCVDVTDTGCGMSAETLERIFDPFYTTKPVGKGTGLGLSIIYGIVKKHGGFIEVKSEVDQGTTFSIHLLTMGEEDEHDEQISSSGH